MKISRRSISKPEPSTMKLLIKPELIHLLRRLKKKVSTGLLKTEGEQISLTQSIASPTWLISQIISLRQNLNQ